MGQGPTYTSFVGWALAQQLTAQGYRVLLQKQPSIRVISDPVLQRAGIPFPEHPTAEERQELDRQITIAKETLIQTGGAGIAANQCATIEKPYQFTIVGVFYDNETHSVCLSQYRHDMPTAITQYSHAVATHSAHCLNHNMQLTTLFYVSSPKDTAAESSEIYKTLFQFIAMAASDGICFYTDIQRGLLQ